MKSKLKLNKFIKIALLFIIAVLLGLYLAIINIQEEGLKNSDNKSPKIEVSGVKVNDFLKEKNAEEESFISIDNTKDYHVFYISGQELFYISITSYPFDEHVVSAENALLQALGITKEDACKLNVDVTTPAYANPEKAGVVYGLSWCAE